MFDFITAPLVVGIICYFIYKLFELPARRKERMMWIQYSIQQNAQRRDGENNSSMPENAPSLLPKVSSNRFTPLRWGCLCTGLGIGLVLAFFISHYLNSSEFGTHFNIYMFNEYYSAIYAASVLLFAGMGLVVAYIVEWRSLKK